MPAGLIENYNLAAGRYDEMLNAEGGARAHWSAFVSRLEGMPAATLLRRAQFVRDAIDSDGVTYNVYNDPKGVRRPWELDLLPLVVDAGEWADLAAALSQRSRLMNAILADLYGPQHLLRESLLPTALVFGQHAFQWACQGVRPPGGVFLHLYAADLARAPNGQWWVIADRTQGPSGAGYGLQNRITLSRTFPDAFRQLQVRPLADFFRTLQDGLARLAPCSDDSPLVVLLTPGPYNETYFEHAFLARYLGFPLVEGQDLTVRHDEVYLKTLRGLRRVHAILRRLDDDFCDPLELRADSALGIPGLLSAARAGKVLIANALGSGVLESAAIMGFLPAISRRLLGEELAIPSVATWWCGEAPALEYVLEHLDELVIKAAFPSMRMESVFGHELKGDSRRRMIERITAQPHAYVAQEWVRLSQAPVWSRRHEGRLMPRSVGLRMFSVAGPDGTYSVMPGALTRVAPREGMEVISMQRGGFSKDTWIPAEGQLANRSSLLKSRLGVMDLVCGGSDIPSRVGENLYWMGRYAERLEASTRLLRAALQRVANSEVEASNTLPLLLAACERTGVLPPEDEEAEPERLEARLLATIFRPELPGSVSSNLRALSASANQVRERLSSDNWHALNLLGQLAESPSQTIGQALNALDRIMLSCISLAGFAMDDMTRDEGWRFLVLGRRVERLAGLAALIGGLLRAPADEREASLEWLLEVANSIVTYRARYRRTPELLPVVHLLVFDESNPHAVAMQVLVIERYLRRIAHELGTERHDGLWEQRARLQSFDLTRLEADHCNEDCIELADLLDDVSASAYRLSDHVHRRFFVHTARPDVVGA